MARDVTLLDLVNAVAEHGRSEAEVIATIVCMVNQDDVRLCGTFSATSSGSSARPIATQAFRSGRTRCGTAMGMTRNAPSENAPSGRDIGPSSWFLLPGEDDTDERN